MALSWAERNPPLPVEFCGFRSDTLTLGRCGWRVAMEQRYGIDRRTQVLCHHEGLGLTLIGEAELDRLLPFELQREGRMRPVQLRYASSRDSGRSFIIQGRPPPLAWVETETRMQQLEEHELYRLPLFAQLNEPAGEQLIVEPATVSELLDQIRRMQAPEQAAIRERERRRDRGNTPRLHAQILSFAA